jgi:hypothetical protein
MESNNDFDFNSDIQSQISNNSVVYEQAPYQVNLQHDDTNKIELCLKTDKKQLMSPAMSEKNMKIVKSAINEFGFVNESDTSQEKMTEYKYLLEHVLTEDELEIMNNMKST